MKKIFSIFAVALMSASMFAAETEYLPISVYAADDTESFPRGAKAMMENKLTQLLTKNGIAGLDYMGQFVLTVTTTPTDKDVIPGPPMKIAEKMEMNLYIVDAYAKTIFSSTSLTVRGLGEIQSEAGKAKALSMTRTFLEVIKLLIVLLFTYLTVTQVHGGSPSPLFLPLVIFLLMGTSIVHILLLSRLK